ncbi:DUF2955 domain-containing protein [Thiolapillus brandeum]|uniref:DUF2955 domain-containing protein n=1 Tax=Thiolapillus brandeum TaxID=1076588 RepID=A0A7U6JH03_9GAMM|nr:DUF2955 domain-containing protein [Thiolapillus brandeum]BAO44034.1 conserved hypothetical protein [Thiolapillus brandeum]
MSLSSRRVFRLALTTALALALAYGMGGLFAFLAPLFAFIVTLKPAPPTGVKGLLVAMTVIVLTSAAGLLLVPLLINYPLVAMTLAALGLYLSAHLTLILGQAALGLFMAMGITLISAAGLYNFALGQALLESLASSMMIAIICQWLVYPFFPEDPEVLRAPPPSPPPDPTESRWIGIRSTLIVLPLYFMALTNPPLFIATIMKSVSLGQQANDLDAAHAGRELLGSTFLAAVFAMLFWQGLSILPNLWMFFLWTFLTGIYIAAKIYGVLATRFTASFWVNVMTTLLILIGPAVADVSSGKDVYTASFVRLSLYVFVSLYAWWTLSILDAWRHRRLGHSLQTEPG